MSKLMRGLKHAFAVERPDSIEPNEAQQAIVDRVCQEIVRRGLTTPALLFLEMSRPMNYVGAQTLHFFQPIVSIIADTQKYQQFAAFLEHRGSVHYLCRRIEHFEQARGEHAAKAKAESGDPRPSAQTGDAPGR